MITTLLSLACIGAFLALAGAAAWLQGHVQDKRNAQAFSDALDRQQAKHRAPTRPRPHAPLRLTPMRVVRQHPKADH